MNIQPYLYFDGRCEEALAFYGETLGAQVEMMMRFKENPAPQMNPPGSAEKVMHCAFRIGETQLLASDGNCGGKAAFQGISLTLRVDDAATARRYFDALGAGGQVQMPMNETFFAKAFGMVADKFGVSWMVISEK